MTVNDLLDRWLEVIDIERKTRTGSASKIDKHIRPTIGRLQVGRVKADTIEGLYVQPRRCRDHCRGKKYLQHRTADEHVCDEHTARRQYRKAVTGDPTALCRTCERSRPSARAGRPHVYARPVTGPVAHHFGGRRSGRGAVFAPMWWPHPWRRV